MTTYAVDGEEYDVVLQTKPEQRESYADLSNIFVRAERSGVPAVYNLMARGTGAPNAVANRLAEMHADATPSAS